MKINSSIGNCAATINWKLGSIASANVGFMTTTTRRTVVELFYVDRRGDSTPPIESDRIKVKHFNKTKRKNDEKWWSRRVMNRECKWNWWKMRVRERKVERFEKSKRRHHFVSQYYSGGFSRSPRRHRRYSLRVGNEPPSPLFRMVWFFQFFPLFFHLKSRLIWIQKRPVNSMRIWSWNITFAKSWKREKWSRKLETSPERRHLIVRPSDKGLKMKNVTVGGKVRGWLYYFLVLESRSSKTRH